MSKKTKPKTQFFFHTPIVKTNIRVDQEKHPLLMAFISNNYDLILKDRQKWEKSDWKRKKFPTYTGKEKAFREMMNQCKCKGDILIVSYDIPTNLIFQMKLRVKDGWFKQLIKAIFKIKTR